MGDDVEVTVHHGAVGLLTGLRDAPLSVDEVLSSVRDPRAGAVALFIGTVRDHDGGHDGVVGLDYSAHPDAAHRLDRLAAAAAAAHGVHRVSVVHRTGTLRVGDLAVVCAVAAEHRAQAFDACRSLVEQLKHTAPIWKHQRFASGASEWVGL